MAFTIRRADTPLTIKSCTATIYAVGGSGKTTLALSCNNPIVLDVEGSSYRAVNAQGAPVVDLFQMTWEQIVSEDLGQFDGFDTIVVDTVGELVRKAMADVIGRGAAHYRQRDGNPTMQGWGALKSAMFGWYDRLRETKKNIVFVFQPTVNQQGQVATLDLEVTGATSDFVKAKSDLIGHILIDESEKRTLDFRPIRGQLGKDPLRFGQVEVPDITAHPQFFGGLISHYISGVNQRNAELAAQYASVAPAAPAPVVQTPEPTPAPVEAAPAPVVSGVPIDQDLVGYLELIEGVDEFNEVASEVFAAGKSGENAPRCVAVIEVAKKRGFVVDRDTKRYRDMAAEIEAIGAAQ